MQFCMAVRIVLVLLTLSMSACFGSSDEPDPVTKLNEARKSVKAAMEAMEKLESSSEKLLADHRKLEEAVAANEAAVRALVAVRLEHARATVKDLAGRASNELQDHVKDLSEVLDSIELRLNKPNGSLASQLGKIDEGFDRYEEQRQALAAKVRR